jgi:hypothetical protein
MGARRVSARDPPYLSSPLAKTAASLPVKSLEDQKATVTHFYDVTVDVGDLLKQADKGQALVLTKANGGIVRSVYSNSYHQSDEAYAEGDVDVLHGDIKFSQQNDIGAELHMALNVPVPETLKALTLVGGVNSAAPYGFLGASVENGGEATLSRNLEAGELTFIATFPGQTAEHQDNFVYPASTNVDESHIRVIPACATLHYYNEMPEVKSKNLTVSEKDADKKGLAYVNKELVTKAKLMCQADMRRTISHCNVTNPDKVEITLSAPPVNKRVAGKSQITQVSLAELIRKNATDEGFSAVANNKKSLAAVEVRFKGSVTVPYIKSCKNFVVK